MGTADFATLQHQFLDQWQAIEQADPAERRVLIIELAKALAEWEAAQEAPLDRGQDLTRTGHWSSVAQVAAAEARRLAERLGEAKPALRQRLDGVGQQIATTEGELQALTPEVEALFQELALAEASLVELEGRLAALHRQRDACQRLGELQAEVAAAKAELDLLGDTLRRGDEPSEVLARLASLRDVVASYYAAYLQASRDIAAQLAGGDSVDAPTAGASFVASASASVSAILDVPDRLLSLDRELKAIDQVLAEHLRSQDAVDLEIKARV